LFIVRSESPATRTLRAAGSSSDAAALEREVLPTTRPRTEDRKN
jgi:hypothetical protein